MGLWKKLAASLPWRRDDRVPVHRLPAPREWSDLEERGGRSLDTVLRDAWRSLGHRAHIDESEAEYSVRVDAPGYDAGDLKVSVSRDRVVIEGALREERGGRDERAWERREGRLYVEIPLPVAVESEAATASLRRGVLTVRLPKSSRTRRSARAVPVGGAR